MCYAILDESISHSSRLWVEPCRQRRRVGDLSIAGNPGGAGVTTTMNVPWLEENVTRRSWVMSSWHLWGRYVIDCDNRGSGVLWGFGPEIGGEVGSTKWAM